MFKAVIFDMDGVLVDSEPIRFEIMKKFCQKLGFTLTDEKLSTFVGGKDTEKWKTLKMENSLPQPPEELERKEIKLYKDHIKNLSEIDPIDGSVELLEKLTEGGIKKGLASSAQREVINLILDRLGIEAYFEVTISGYEVENAKPAPDIFLETAKRLDVLPKECVVIEDSQNGARAAKAAGMKCIGFLNPNSGNQDLSFVDMIVRNLSELDFERIESLF